MFTYRLERPPARKPPLRWRRASHIYVYIYTYIHTYMYRSIDLSMYTTKGTSKWRCKYNPNIQILGLTLLYIHTLPGGPLPLLCSRSREGGGPTSPPRTLPHPEVARLLVNHFSFGDARLTSIYIYIYRHIYLSIYLSIDLYIDLYTKGTYKCRCTYNPNIEVAHQFADHFSFGDARLIYPSVHIYTNIKLYIHIYVYIYIYIHLHVSFYIL